MKQNNVSKCPLLNAAGILASNSGSSTNGRSRARDNWIKELCFKHCPLQDEENDENDYCVYDLHRQLNKKEKELFRKAIEKWREDESKSSKQN